MVKINQNFVSLASVFVGKKNFTKEAINRISLMLLKKLNNNRLILKQKQFRSLLVGEPLSVRR